MSEDSYEETIRQLAEQEILNRYPQLKQGSEDEAHLVFIRSGCMLLTAVAPRYCNGQAVIKFACPVDAELRQEIARFRDPARGNHITLFPMGQAEYEELLEASAKIAHGEEGWGAHQKYRFENGRLACYIVNHCG